MEPAARGRQAGTIQRKGSLCKMGASVGAEPLLTFKDRVDTRRSGPPEALGVIVATGFGNQRPDGVGVIPIGALGP